MTTEKLAAALIAVFEGCRLTAYQDTGGIWTIGFGHTGPEVKMGLTITQDQADSMFAQDMEHLFDMVKDKPALTGAALVSFGYNCGAGALAKVMAGTSTLMTFIHDSKGNVLPGLQRRRMLEQALIDASQDNSASVLS